MTINSLGKFLYQKRQAANLSQAKLARMVGWSSPQFLSNIERDEASVPPTKVFKLAKALGTNPEEIIKRHMAHYEDYYRKTANGQTTTPRRTPKTRTVKKAKR